MFIFSLVLMAVGLLMALVGKKAVKIVGVVLMLIATIMAYVNYAAPDNKVEQAVVYKNAAAKALGNEFKKEKMTGKAVVIVCNRLDVSGRIMDKWNGKKRMDEENAVFCEELAKASGWEVETVGVPTSVDIKGEVTLKAAELNKIAMPEADYYIFNLLAQKIDTSLPQSNLWKKSCGEGKSKITFTLATFGDEGADKLAKGGRMPFFITLRDPNSSLTSRAKKIGDGHFDSQFMWVQMQ